MQMHTEEKCRVMTSLNSNSQSSHLQHQPWQGQSFIQTVWWWLPLQRRPKWVWADPHSHDLHPHLHSKLLTYDLSTLIGSVWINTPRCTWFTNFSLPNTWFSIPFTSNTYIWKKMLCRIQTILRVRLGGGAGVEEVNKLILKPLTKVLSPFSSLPGCKMVGCWITSPAFPIMSVACW